MFITIRNWFHSFFNALIWLCFIGCTAAGLVIGGNMEHPFIGAILGFLVGLAINVIWGGFLATIISIDTNLEEIKARLNKGNIQNVTPPLS